MCGLPGQEALQSCTVETGQPEQVSKLCEEAW
jgi:hypothetical protein